jgi:hypothetical protein
MNRPDMNDPHVEKLFYRLVIPEHTDYNHAPPISGEVDDFKWDLNKDHLLIEMKVHCATENDAKRIVAAFLREWEVSAGLCHGPDNLKFTFQRSKIIDRMPDRKVINLQASISGCTTTSLDAILHVSQNQFPTPPQSFKVTPEVERMYLRYGNYQKGKESLLSIAYWCLTLLEGSTKVSKKKRITAADQYGIDIEVLNELGRLSSEAGDETEARKFTDKSTLVRLTPSEKTWVESVVKKLIERMAEYAHDPSAKRSQVTMPDFPALGSSLRRREGSLWERADGGSSSLGMTTRKPRQTTGRT